MGDKYIVGTEPIPAWCRGWLMPYQKLDGAIGWEFYGKRRSYELSKGDVLIKQDCRILVDKKKRA